MHVKDPLVPQSIHQTLESTGYIARENTALLTVVIHCILVQSTRHQKSKSLVGSRVRLHASATCSSHEPPFFCGSD